MALYLVAHLCELLKGLRETNSGHRHFIFLFMIPQMCLLRTRCMDKQLQHYANALELFWAGFSASIAIVRSLTAEHFGISIFFFVPFRCASACVQTSHRIWDGLCWRATPCITMHPASHCCLHFGRMAFKNTDEDTNLHPAPEIDELALDEKFCLWKYN